MPSDIANASIERDMEHLPKKYAENIKSTDKSFEIPKLFVALVLVTVAKTGLNDHPNPPHSSRT